MRTRSKRKSRRGKGDPVATINPVRHRRGMRKCKLPGNTHQICQVENRFNCRAMLESLFGQS